MSCSPPFRRPFCHARAFCFCVVFALAAACAPPLPAAPEEPSRPDTPAHAPLPAVVVLTSCPGLPAASVEKAVTDRIERWVNQAPGVRRIESRSLAGLSVVTVSFERGSDLARALVVVNSLALGSL